MLNTVFRALTDTAPPPKCGTIQAVTTMLNRAWKGTTKLMMRATWLEIVRVANSTPRVPTYPDEFLQP